MVQPATGTVDPPHVSLTDRSARRWLVLVGVAYAVVQLSSFELDRAPSWDEAIYLSQVAPGADAYHFTAWRARGITILVAPLAGSESLPVIRVGLALLASVALVGAFLPWLATIGTGAAAGAAFLGSTWAALFYGSEVMPNLWVGLAGLAALGFVARPSLGTDRGRDAVAAASLLFAAGLFRPFDAVLLACAVTFASIVVGRRPVRTAGLLALGLGAGCLPWFVEMSIRYGGLRAVLDQGMVVTRLSVPDPWDRVVQYLATADGPSTPPVTDSGVPFTGVLMVVVAMAVAAFGIVVARRSSSAGPLVAALGGALLVTGAYVGLVGVVAPRFLLPAVALLAVPVAFGLVALWRRPAGAASRTALVAALVAWPVWQASVAVRLESGAARQRADVQEVGRRIERETDGRRCVVASVVGAPQLGYASGCRGRAVVDVGTVDQVLREETSRGISRVFLVLRAPLNPPPTGTVERWAVDTPGTGPLTVFRVELGRGARSPS